MEKFRTFAVLFGAERGQKAQQISFASSPRFVRSHAINLHTRKVFLSSNEVKLEKNVTWLPYRRSPGKNLPTEGKIIPARNSLAGTGKSSDRFIREGEFSHVKFWPLVSQLVLWPMFIIVAKKVPKQNFPKMPRAPNSTLGLILD